MEPGETVTGITDVGIHSEGDRRAPDGATSGVKITPASRVSLWRHRDFLYFWVGQSTSMLGSAVSTIALPLVGVLLLNFDAMHMGIVASVTLLPTVIVSPFIGPVVDRMDRRRLMIAADIGRALLLASIPIGYWMHVLGFAQIIVVGGGMGILTLTFNVAHQAFLPNVVETRSLADGNGKLEASQSVAEVSGPGLAGWLIGIGGPAVAVIADAASYVISVFCLTRVRERPRTPPQLRSSDGVKDGETVGGGQGRFGRFWEDTKSGFRLLWADPVLRAVSVSYAALALFAQIQMAVYMLMLVRGLNFGPWLIGLVFSLSSVVGFISALVSGRLTERFGVGRLIVIGQASMVAGGILLAAVGGSTFRAAATMLLAEAFFANGMSFYGVGSRTLNQTRVAEEVRGRIIGASKVLTGVLCAGAGVIGGALGAAFGLRAAMVVGAVGMTVSLVLVIRPQVWAVRSVAMDEGAL